MKRLAALTFLFVTRCDGPGSSGTSDVTSPPSDATSPDAGGGDTARPDTTASGTCDFTACGGTNLTGEWSITGFCLDAPPLPNPFAQFDGCRDVEFAVRPDADGTMRFGADQVYEYYITFSGLVDLVLDRACIDDLAGVVTCDSIAQEFAEDGNMLECTSQSDGGCACHGSAEPSVREGEGTWRVEGDELIIEELQTTRPTTTFCVQGTTLKLHQSDTDEGQTTTSVMTLTRK